MWIHKRRKDTLFCINRMNRDLPEKTSIWDQTSRTFVARQVCGFVGFCSCKSLETQPYSWALQREHSILVERNINWLDFRHSALTMEPFTLGTDIVSTTSATAHVTSQENATYLAVNFSRMGRNDTAEEDTNSIPLTRILLCAMLFVIVVLTIAGNVVVLLAFAIVKRLTKVRKCFFPLYLKNTHEGPTARGGGASISNLSFIEW